jgi:hypothetical protein
VRPTEKGSRTRRLAALLRAIRSLPAADVAMVEEFVGLRCCQGDRELTHAAASLGAKAFGRIWNNPADAAYDLL